MDGRFPPFIFSFISVGPTVQIEFPPMSQRLNFRSILYPIFFLSGATGLVYEVIWVRLTGLVFGNTSQAISTVLGAFMAGCVLGRWKIGGKAGRPRNTPLIGGIRQIGIPLSAADVPPS